MQKAGSPPQEAIRLIYGLPYKRNQPFYTNDPWWSIGDSNP